MTQNTPEITNQEITAGLIFLGWETSPVLTNNYTTNNGVDGSTFNTTTIGQSVINAKFELFTRGYYDMNLARHDIYKLFAGKDLFRIRTDASPTKVAFVRAGSFDITPAKAGSRQALITIPFDNPSGYLYSLLTSDNLMTYEAQGWQIGMSLPNGQDLHYQFSTPNMRVYNASDIAVDPYYQRHQLKIVCKFSGSSLKLTNKTNDSEWEYMTGSNGKQTIILDGITTTLNGVPASSSTDFGNLVLDPGWNDIVATGATTLDVTFSFPFIYLG